MKKKLTAIALVVALLAIAVIGGTLAYFTDTDAQKNTFTTGNVAIDLYEDFGDNTGIEELIPATGSEGAGTLKNAVEKEVYVMNTGSEDAYVRVHIAIPQLLDDGADTFNASANILHFNYTKDSNKEAVWDWSKAYADGKMTGDWNYYETEIDDIVYNVYVVTYPTALATDESTPSAIYQVYLDNEVTNEDISELKEALGDQWYIYVAAEGCQAEGFNDPYTALNTSFGTPGATGYVAPTFTATAEGRIFQNLD